MAAICSRLNSTTAGPDFNLPFRRCFSELDEDAEKAVWAHIAWHQKLRRSLREMGIFSIFEKPQLRKIVFETPCQLKISNDNLGIRNWRKQD